MSRRTERVASTLHQELAMIMQRELSDPRLTGLPSITRVKVSDDLSAADVYITVMGTPGQQNAALIALKHSAGMMRTLLTKQMTLRVAPFLKFHIDEDLKKELELEAVLRKVADENAELDRKRAAAEAEAAAAAAANNPDAQPDGNPFPDNPPAAPAPETAAATDPGQPTPDRITDPT